MALQNVTKIERSLTLKVEMIQDGYFMCFRNSEIMDALLASEYKLHWKCVCLVYSVSFLQ